MQFAYTKEELVDLRRSLTFDDVMLDQNKCVVNSRSEIITTSEVIRGIFRPVPIIGSNMTSVMNADFAIKLWELGALGVLHRAYKDVNIYYKEVEKVANNCEIVCASIGINNNSFDLFCELRRRGMNCVFIDVAHGWQERAIALVKDIKETYPEIKIVVGNFINPAAFQDFIITETLWELTKVIPLVDAFKIGIGQSPVCETAFTAGAGMGQLSAVLRCQEIAKNYGIPIISDGGISAPHHFVKALAASANSVMMGRVLAMCPESAAETVWISNSREVDINKSWEISSPNNLAYQKKKYYGMMCYSQDTECLTENGWKFIKDVTLTDKVATLDMDKNLKFHNPLNTYVYSYSGKMVRVKSQQLDLLITPNHNMYVAKRARIKDGYKQKFKFVEAQNCEKETYVYNKTCNWEGELLTRFTFSKKGKSVSVPINEWMDFFGFWLAEGCLSSEKERYMSLISISNNNEQLIKHYESLIQSWGCNTGIRCRGNNYELSFSSIPICDYLRKFGHSYNKYIPTEIKKLSPNLLKTLLRSMFLGDGRKKNHISTASVKLKDDIYEIAIKCGFTPNAYICEYKGSGGQINGKIFKRNYDVWEVYIGNYNKNGLIIKPHHYTREQYSGNVYCVEVPNNTLCVRRNNKFAWCGNSRYSQESWHGEVRNDCPEGKVTYLDVGEPVKSLLRRYIGALRSGISYAGGSDIKSFQKNVRFILSKS